MPDTHPSSRARPSAGSGWPAVAELLAVVALAVADVLGRVPFSLTPFLFLVGWISLRRRGLRWRDVGLARPRRWGRTLALGCLAGVALELFSTFVTVPLFSRLAGAPPDLSDFRPLVGNWRFFAVLMVLNWVLAAFGEEMTYRGYLTSRLAGLGHGSRRAWIVSLLASSLFFGSIHDSQGPTGMAQESLAGFLLGLLYLASGRQLALPIVAHGVSNTVAFVLIYFGRYPGI